MTDPGAQEGGGALRRVGLALKTGQKSKDKYCFLLSILVVWIMQGIGGCMVGVRVVCNIWESSYSLSTYIYYLQIINMIFQFLLEGRWHDAGMLRDSQLLQSLQMFAFNLHGQPMCIYGDPAYPLRIHLQAPFRNGVLTPQMQAYNSAMSEVRSSVEWLFGDVIN